MPFSYVFGTALTWTFIGVVAGGGDWRIAFWLPGLLLLLVLAFWRRAGIDAPKARPSRVRPAAIIAEARGIAFALLAAALGGFVFNGIIIWLPTYILDTGLIAEHLVGLVAAAMQVMAIGGLFLARYRVVRSNQVLRDGGADAGGGRRRAAAFDRDRRRAGAVGGCAGAGHAERRLRLDREFHAAAAGAARARLFRDRQHQYDVQFLGRDGRLQHRRPG